MWLAHTYGEPGEYSPQSPYGTKWFATHSLVQEALRRLDESQSPYGAKWFATNRTPNKNLLYIHGSQSPYGAKRFATLPPLRTPFWTALSEGGFVRKMKLGICMGRITGVSGVCADERTQERGPMRRENAYCPSPREELAFKVPTRRSGLGGV